MGVLKVHLAVHKTERVIHKHSLVDRSVRVPGPASELMRLVHDHVVCAVEPQRNGGVFSVDELTPRRHVHVLVLAQVLRSGYPVNMQIRFSSPGPLESRECEGQRISQW